MILKHRWRLILIGRCHAFRDLKKSKGKKVPIKGCRVKNKCLTNTYKSRVEFEFRVAGAYLSMLKAVCRTWEVLESAGETRRIPQ